MWSREELKNRAKAVLRGSYWKAFLVSLVLGFAAGGSSGGFPSWNFNQRSLPNYYDGYYESPWNTDVILPIIIAAIAVSILVILFALAFRIFLGYTLEVGCKRYFVKSTQNDVNLNNIGFGFNKIKYLSILKAMLWKDLFTFLWSLLFLIPGIVKSYSYAMVPYILADNPNTDYRRAIELSMKMTNNQKLEMFILDLSFIGWSILGLLACCIGIVFLQPYINATKAELYIVLRQNALAQGFCTPEELMLNPVGMSQGTVL